MRKIIWAIATTTLLVAVGCKPKAGDACKPNEAACSDKASALICTDGRYVAADCKGADGCTAQPFRCDFRGNPDGDRCFEAHESASYCGPGWKSRVSCVKSKVEVEACDGQKACYAATDTTKGCDQIKKIGAACKMTAGAADPNADWCSTDHHDWLQCKDSKLTLVSPCRGTGGCRTMEGMVACDTSIGEPNDPCVGKLKTCSSDHTKILTCDGGKLSESSTCAKPKACRLEDSEPTCS